MKAETSLHIVRVLIGGSLVYSNPALAAGLGVAKVALDAWTSAKALLKGDKAKKAASLENRLATKVETHITSRKSEYPNADEAALLLTQMIEASLPNRAELVGNTLTAEGALRAMQAKLPTLPEYQTPTAKALFNSVVLDVLTELLNDADFVETLQPMISRSLLAGQSAIKEDTSETLERVKNLEISLEKALAQSPRVRKARQAGVTEIKLIAIARRIAPLVSDAEQALKTLEAAVEIAIADQTSGQKGSNVEVTVIEAIKHVHELSDVGQFDQASAAAGNLYAFWLGTENDRQAKAIQEGVMILRVKIAQDTFRLDAPAIAESELQKITLESPAQPANFEALSQVRRDYFERGRDKGINFDLEVSVELGQLTLTRAEGADQRGTALNSLGLALSTLGAREGGTARLEKAVKVFRDALAENTRERVPMSWAMIQNNLGTALQTLGEREGITERQEEAVTAFRAALEEWTRALVPLNWAGTQNNLGNALKSLGESAGDTVRLAEAVAAYGAALEEWTRARVPLNWAATQNNLGNALGSIGEREGGTARLEEAVAAYHAALEERTRERVPLDWAATQNNLGNALRTLGERKGSKERLEEAVTACQAALKERTREKVPLHWAGTQHNLTGAFLALFGLTRDPLHLAAARAANDLALNLLRTADAPAYLAIAETTRQRILAATPTPDPTP